MLLKDADTRPSPPLRQITRPPFRIMLGENLAPKTGPHLRPPVSLIIPTVVLLRKNGPEPFCGSLPRPAG